jgi:uncharacterized protein (TIGR02996 family)
MAFWPHLCPPRPEVFAFLEDIREHPDDDAPRLILADWLDDQGDPVDSARAELIRLQCRLVQPGTAPASLRLREHQLLEQFAGEFLGPLAGLAEYWQFDRGLVELGLEGASCFSPELLDIVRTETYAWVEGLTLLRLTGGAINPLVQHPILRGIRSLTVEDSRVGDLGAGLFLTSPHLAGLRNLNLTFCSINDGGVHALATSPHLVGLEALDLTRNRVGAVGMRALSRASAFPRLRQLRLGHCGVPDGSLADLAASTLLANLEWLDLQGNRQCGDSGLAALLESPNASRLRVLSLQQTAVHLRTIQVMARSPHLERLTHLHLDSTGVGNECLKALAFSELLGRLHTLSLGRNHLTDAGVVALTLSPPRPWRALELGRNHLGAESAVALATCSAMAELTELGLEDNRIGDEGALALAASPFLGKLRLLDVGNNGLSAAGKAVLLRRFGRGRVAV